VAGTAGAAFGPAGKIIYAFRWSARANLLEDALERIERVSTRWRATVSR